jgi:protoporphyrinogen oxidase
MIVHCPIIILGAGAAGLGAAYRLTEHKVDRFLVLERNPYPGGHAASFRTPEGFTFDEGGHVLFSHYPYFESVVEAVLQGNYLRHQRNSWIWLDGTWVRYPFQEHIFQLPPPLAYECLSGLVDASVNEARSPTNFQEWIELSFGAGISRLFMTPYNQKVWAHPLHRMDYRWIGERVATVDLKAVLRRMVFREESSWGPNSVFLYPLEGGFGGLISGLCRLLNPDSIRLGEAVVRIVAAEHLVELRSGTRLRYDALISTIPLPDLLRLVDSGASWLGRVSDDLLYNGVFVVGIGCRGQVPHLKHWVYFPEEKYPFYRLTFLSNYSPALVPCSETYSLLVEVAFSPHRPIQRRAVLARTLTALEELGWLRRQDILSVWTKGMRYAYPIPALGRDRILRELQAFLERHAIYSRGRFGGWRYEVGNTDHAFMQGVEVVDRILLGRPESVYVV